MSRRYCMPSKEICSDAGVRARDRFREVGATADDGQHAAAGGHESTVALRGAGVIDRDARNRLRRRRCPRSACPTSDDSG